MPQSPTVLARRLRIFSFAKAFMQLRGRAPTTSEVRDGLGLPESLYTILCDFHALEHADGLPFPLRSPKGNPEPRGMSLASAPVDSFMANPHMHKQWGAR